MAEPEKYLDLLESIKKGVVCEISYNEVKEVIDPSSSDEMKELITRLYEEKYPNNEGRKHARPHSQER